MYVYMYVCIIYGVYYIVLVFIISFSDSWFFFLFSDHSPLPLFCNISRILTPEVPDRIYLPTYARCAHAVRAILWSYYFRVMPKKNIKTNNRNTDSWSTAAVVRTMPSVVDDFLIAPEYNNASGIWVYGLVFLLLFFFQVGSPCLIDIFAAGPFCVFANFIYLYYTAAPALHARAANNTHNPILRTARHVADLTRIRQVHNIMYKC